MKNFVLGLVVATGAMTVLIAAQTKINPTDPQPTCNMCPGYYIPAAELEAYTKKAIAENLVDQQVRSIDIGKANVAIGIEYRKKLDKPGANSVAEHDQVSEVYRILDGSATLVLGPDMVNRQRRPATQRTVVEYNGPGNNGESVRNGLTLQLKAGDMVEVKEKSKQLALVIEATGLSERDVPDYIEVDHTKMTAKLTRVPHLTEVPYPVQMEPHLIIEFYSR